VDRGKDRRRLSQGDRKGAWVSRFPQGVRLLEPVVMLSITTRREWFAITAFPLFVGTFGPIASALNICALVQPWRCHLAPNGVNAGDNIADPVW
jgi:hypothetical protein